MTEGLTFHVNGELRENVANSTLVMQITNNTKISNPPFFLTLPSELFVGSVGGFQVFDSKDGKLGPCGQATKTTDQVQQPDKSTKWKITLPRDANFKQGKEIGLQLIFKPRSSGPYKISIDWDLVNSTVKGAQTEGVTVLKSGESPDIVNFAYKLTSDSTGKYARLDWETDSDSTVAIYRGDERLSSEPLSAKMQGWPGNGLKLRGGLEIFRLDATNKTSSRTVSRWQFFVSSLPGWNQESGFGELLCMVNDSDNALYGVLSNDRKTAALRKFAVGADNLGVLAADFNVDVPDAMRTSPGAFFLNAIWLVGGSQVDPGACSNEIWCYDPKTKKAHSFTANWPARMGHALVVFQNGLWILGGLDANGNALDDVWFYKGTDTFNQADKSVLAWKPAVPLSTPICQPSVAAFTDGAATSQRERLWLTGGADSPWGAPQQDTYCLELTGENPAEGTWNKVSGSGTAASAARMFASAFCVGERQGQSVLYWLGTRPSDVESFDCSMIQIVRDPGKWSATTDYLYKSIDESKRWPIKVRPDIPIEPFRLTAVSFKNFVFVYSLFYGATSPYFSYLLS
jgi:hypothetical protein